MERDAFPGPALSQLPRQLARPAGDVHHLGNPRCHSLSADDDIGEGEALVVQLSIDTTDPTFKLFASLNFMFLRPSLTTHSTSTPAR